MNIRVALADDHSIVREGVRSLLEQEAGIEVVAQVSDGHAAVATAREVRPHVILMDLMMPGMNGFEATRRIAKETPDARILCLSMHADRRFVIEALRAGASGYILKDAPVGELALAIRTLAEGHKYVSPAVTGTVIDGLTGAAPRGPAEPAAELTAREREVLQLLAEGGATKEIALRLEISAKTVATHREHLMQKLQIHSIAGLTKYAIRHGLTTTDRHRPN